MTVVWVSILNAGYAWATGAGSCPPPLGVFRQPRVIKTKEYSKNACVVERMVTIYNLSCPKIVAFYNACKPVVICIYRSRMHQPPVECMECCRSTAHQCLGPIRFRRPPLIQELRLTG